MVLRSGLMALAVTGAALAGGCNKQETANNYDPRVDGVQSRVVAMAEPGILDDPKTAPRASTPAGGNRPTPTAPTPGFGGTGTTTRSGTTTAPETGPAPETAPGPETPGTPIAPPETAPAPSPPPDLG